MCAIYTRVCVCTTRMQNFVQIEWKEKTHILEKKLLELGVTDEPKGPTLIILKTLKAHS